jgi:hypothetical protein
MGVSVDGYVSTDDGVPTQALMAAFELLRSDRTFPTDRPSLSTLWKSKPRTVEDPAVLRRP